MKIGSWLKKGLSTTVILTILFSAIAVPTIWVDGATDMMDWRRNDTMDINLNIVANKAGPNDLLFEMDVEQAGTYTFEYYLENQRKTTVNFQNSYGEMGISYKIEEQSGGVITNITQDQVDLSYLEVDYSLQVPSWQYDDSKTVTPGTETLDYIIERSASSKYPGIAFEINNRRFIAKWDFQANKLYILIDGYQPGFMMPVHFDAPTASGTAQETIHVLKSLEDFSITPTHLVDNGGVNEDITPIVQPNSPNRPGNRPGLLVEFKQPQELDSTDWTYGYNHNVLDNVSAVFELEDISSPDYLDFIVPLQNGGSSVIGEVPSENTTPVSYKYDAATHTYQIQIVQDKSDLNEQDHIIEWNDLKGSHIYNADVGFQVSGSLPTYEFARFYPQDNFAYTYLEYTLRRSDQQEAFLEITPYETGARDEVEYTILYSKTIPDSSQRNLDPVNDLWLKHYETEGNNTTMINIPVPFRAKSSQDVYQVIVNFSNTDIYSQLLNYRAIDDENVPPTTPSIEGVERVYVVPPLDPTLELPSKMQFDLIWEAIENRSNPDLDDIFNGGGDDAVYYEVLINDVPDIMESNPFEVFRVYELTQDAGGDYHLTSHPSTTDRDDLFNETNYVDGYNSIEQLLRMGKIVLYDGLNPMHGTSSTTPVIDVALDEDADTYTVAETNQDIDLSFPGVNYIRIRAITQKDGEFTASNYSVPVSLSLSMETTDVPIVTGLAYEPFYSLTDETKNGVNITWSPVNLDEYENSMLAPLDIDITKLHYKVFLSEDKGSLLNLDESTFTYRSIPVASGEAVIDQTDPADPNDLNDLEYLRETFVDTTKTPNATRGNVVVFDVDQSQTPNIKITGLDMNTVYYARVVTVLELEDTANQPMDARESDPSSILSITTPIVPPEPGDDDEIPLAPETLTVDVYDDSESSAKLTWTIPEEVTLGKDEFGFEIVAIEDMRLPDELRSKANQLSDIYDSDILEGHVIELWRLFYDTTSVVLQKYDPETDTYRTINDALITLNDRTVEIVDDDNAPNRVNYYYVRTVNVNNRATVKASSWREGTLTTSPVKGPVNLIVDYSDTYDYNPAYATIIRFDAPVPDNANLYDDYIMQVYVKGENDLDYVLAKEGKTTTADDYHADRIGREEGPVGYSRLYYEITGLRAGKQYEIKVRIEDRTQPQEQLPDGQASYPVSPFSDKVVTRTEFNQDDYDQEQKYQQYIDYYLEKADELKQSPYFQLRTNNETGVLKYRLSYTNGLLQNNAGNVYTLEYLDKQSTIYYIPADIVERANSSNVTFEVRPKGQRVLIHPYSVGKNITKEIADIVDDMNDYGSTIDDYYVQIVISADTYKGTINGQDPEGPLVDIQMRIIGSRMTEEDLDNAMLDRLDAAINSGRYDLIDELEKELALGINDTKLTYIVQDVLDDVLQDFQSRGQYLLEGQLVNYSYGIDELNRSMTVGMVPTSDVGDYLVYSRSQLTGWKQEAATYYNRSYQVKSPELGSYIIVSRSDFSELSDEYTTAQIDILNKYHLSEVFTTNSIKKPRTRVTNGEMIQSFARLMGAGTLNDTRSYLLGKGIHLSALNELSMLRKEDATYVYVQVYAKKHQIDLNNVRIKDYAAIDDLNTVTSSYQQTILKGVALGVVDLENHRLNPNAYMDIGNFFDLMETIE